MIIGVIPIHPDFTVWVLANRPGFPFHGNNFFREVGDCFSAHVIQNPDLRSEMTLLSSYGPNVPPSTLRTVAASFGDLRGLADGGEISYPYSTREAVAVTRHLEMYPEDDIVSVLHNVLDMDSYDERLYSRIAEIFRGHGIAFTDHESRGAYYGKEAGRGRGGGENELYVRYDRPERTEGVVSESPPDPGLPKFGKWDEKNEAHVGGNRWAGGTGGSDTAGLGGRGGPYRLDRGHKVHQVSDEAKAEVSREAAAAARAIAEKGLSERLKEIGMSESDWDTYKEFLDPIRGEISSLRGILNAVESRKAERDWIKRQSYGELDDSKLVDGVAGERHIYKRRGMVEPSFGRAMKQPKRLRFVMDCSGSMYRFNSYDGRLNRCLQAAALVMESFDGMQSRCYYSIVGHSGDSPCIQFVDFGNPPANAKNRMKVLKQMAAHSQYCQSGDFTIDAMRKAILDIDSLSDVDEDSADENIVIGVSDANLARYGIRPQELGKLMETDASSGKITSKSYCIFIASFGEEAEDIRSSLPAGRGFVCKETSELPKMMKEILAAAVV